MKSVVAIASAVLVVAGSLVAADEDALKDIKCVVSGRAVKAEHAVEYKGGKVYFCCPNCPKAFEKETEKFAAKANHQLYATKQAKLVKCPLAGRDLNTATAIEVAGVKVCFCCNGCKGKATEAEGDAQINLIFNDKAFEKGFKVATKEDK